MAQYTFVDTIEDVPFPALPAEALSIDGTYIEDEIPGYRTLRVSGRELLLRDLETFEVGYRDGASLKGSRFPARVITVEYQLLCADDQAFREAYISLCNLLNVTEVQCIFADEPDKYYIGTPHNAGEVPWGTNRVVSTFEILCMDPFKYSVEEYEVSPDPDAEESDTFIVDYGGTYRSFPTLQADFYQSDAADNHDGDCGFVAFMNENEKVLQFGNPDEGNTESVKYRTVIREGTTTTWYSSERLVNAVFNKVPTDWSKNTGVKTYASDQVFSGSVTASAYAGAETNEFAIKPSSYGSGSKLHGPSILKTIPNDSKNKSEAKDWTVQYGFRFACSHNKQTASASIGSQQCLIWNHSNNKIIAGVEFYKNTKGSNGLLSLIVNGVKVKSLTVDVSATNAIAGWGRAANKQKKLIALRRGPSRVSIVKKGNTVTFTIPYRNKDGQRYDQQYKYSFVDNSIKEMIATRMQFNFFVYGTRHPIEYNGIYWATFTSNSVLNSKTEYTEEKVAEQVNIDHTFSTNDSILADTSVAEVYRNDTREPGLGALGNDWEDFYLSPGINQIHCSYSDWVEDTYKPTFKLRYREVFL